MTAAPVCHALPDTQHYTARSYAYQPVCGSCFSGVLEISQTPPGNASPQWDVYAVEEYVPEWDEPHPDSLPRLPPFPRFFLVAKCNPKDEGLYLVRVSQGAGIGDLCQCFGFNRWQGCKHVAALSDLIGRQEL